MLLNGVHWTLSTLQCVLGLVKDASPSDYYKICSIYSCQTCMGKPFPTSPESVAVKRTDESAGFNTSSIFAATNNTSVDPLSYVIGKNNDSLEIPEEIKSWQEGEFMINLDGGVQSRRPVNNDEPRVPPSQPIHDDYGSNSACESA